MARRSEDLLIKKAYRFSLRGILLLLTGTGLYFAGLQSGLSLERSRFNTRAGEYQTYYEGFVERLAESNDKRLPQNLKKKNKDIFIHKAINDALLNEINKTAQLDQLLLDQFQL